METSTHDERRTQKRMEVGLPILLEWSPGRGIIQRLRGFTTDISLFGVYCYVQEPIPEGRPIEFDVVFPAELTSTAPLVLHCRGTALRSEQEGRLFGLAASIESRETRELREQRLESEQRLHRRIKPDHSISVECPGLRAVIRDLSETGAFIADERPLPVGRQLDLRFPVDGGSGLPIQVRAVVRRVEPHVGMAVEFTSLSQEAAAGLRQMVAAKNFQPELQS